MIAPIVKKADRIIVRFRIDLIRRISVAMNVDAAVDRTACNIGFQFAAEESTAAHGRNVSDNVDVAPGVILSPLGGGYLALHGLAQVRSDAGADGFQHVVGIALRQVVHDHRQRVFDGGLIGRQR